jgi:pimeloyl-ACP methyl ester carboxylesterase
MLRPVLLCSTALFISSCCSAIAQSLPRRADLGTAIMHPEGGKPATLVRFREGSVLEKAGFKVGDGIVAMNGSPVGDEDDFGAKVRSLREGQALRLKVRRGNEEIEREVVLPAMRLEAIDGMDVRYGEARSSRGYRVRTYTTRPRNVDGRLPLVVFIPWLSCDPVENPFNGRDGWSFMLRDVMRGARIQMVRIEKPGVGDSEGPDCASTDLDNDMDAFRAGIRAALADPGVDPSKLFLVGGSVGGALVPILAREFEVRGIIASGGFTRTWQEHMYDIERRRLTLSGTAPSEVNHEMRTFSPFAGTHLYGRAMRYYQQLQALNVEGAWAEVKVPTLIVWGEYDWIMGREESDRAASIIASRDPKLVTYIVRPKMNHHFHVFADRGAAFQETDGKYDAGAAAVMVDWMRRFL